MHLLTDLKIALPASFFAVSVGLEEHIKLLFFIKLRNIDELLIFY